MRLDLDAKLTASEAAALVGVSRQTFNHWRAKGHILRDRAGMYRYGDVVDTERAMRRSPRSSRGAVIRRALADAA